jgi:hypothetical protein
MVKSAATSTKKTVRRDPRFVDESRVGYEPVWDTKSAAKLDDKEFDSLLTLSFNYYNYFYTTKDLKKYVVEWMKENKKMFTPKQVQAFQRSSDKDMSSTACFIVMCHRKGMPFRERVLNYLVNEIHQAIKKSGAEPVEVAVKQEVKVVAPSIQDRLNEKTSELIGEIEGEYDRVISKEKNQFNAYEFFVANKVPQSQLNKYQEVYSDRRVELELAQKGEDEQLKEGYAHYRVADFKRHIAFIDMILSAIEQYRGVKKATKKVRVKRPVSKEKLVARLKYLKDDKALKMVSINPADIPGSQELWVYNIRTRKLGRYVADSVQGPLTVKGTGIVGFDAARSVSKTLRKPDEKLKEFAKAGKVQLRKFLDEIRATETKLTGRISPDTLLLRVQ